MRGLLHILIQLAAIDALSMKLVYSESSKNYFNQKFGTQKRAEQGKQYSNPYITNNYFHIPRDNLPHKNEYFKKEIN